MNAPSTTHLFRLLICLISIILLVATARAADPCSIPNFVVSANPGVIIPTAIVVDDFNKDGRPDMAAASTASFIAGTVGSISILLGNGTGGFSPAPNLGPVSPASIASGDLNGDGNPDLVVGNSANLDDALAIFLGNGAGGFGSSIRVPLGPAGPSRISGVAIADFNGDGKQDIAASSSTLSNITILAGNGTGNVNFLTSVSSGGFFPDFLLVRDINGDSKADLLVANTGGRNPSNSSPKNIAIHLGDGAGNFAAPVTLLSGAIPGRFAVADFDTDGKSDLAVLVGSSVSFLRGDGTGSFGSPTNFGLRGMVGAAIGAADFNADGKLDLGIVTPAAYLMIAGDGSGGFQLVANFISSSILISFNVPDGLSNPLAIADFNGDTRPDVAVGNQNQDRLPVFLNACGSAVPAQIQFNSTNFWASERDGFVNPSIVRSGDITGSATFDFATANNTAIAGQDYAAVSGTLNFAPGEISKSAAVSIIQDNIGEASEDFSLTFTSAVGAVLVEPKTAMLTILDDDGMPTGSINDASVTEGNSGQSNAVFTVTLSHPSSFTITMNYATADIAATTGVDYQTTSGTLTINPGEVTGNINVPVIGDVVPEVNETFTVKLSNATNVSLTGTAQVLGTIVDDDSSCPAPSFGVGMDFEVGSNPFDLVVADFNADSKKDLAVANRGSNNVSILLGNGTGGFASPTNIAVGSLPSQIAAADFNLDGKVDLVTNNGGGISVLLGDGNGGFSVTTTQPVLAPAGLAVADFNADGKPDLALLNSGNKVSILFGDGSGAFGTPTDYTLPGTSPIFISAADLNGDNKTDLVVANQNSNNVSVLLNNGSGTLGAAINSPAGSKPQSVAAGDLNGDGKADLVVANATSFPAARILIGDGAGGFSLLSTLSVGDAWRVALADLNSDGQLDIAISENADASFSSVRGVWVFFGNGAGAFTTPVKYLAGNYLGGVVAADFNSDGRLDLATVTTRSTKVALLLNTCSTATVSFSSSTYTVGETGGRVNVTVNRAGDISSPATVDYATGDQSTSTSCHFNNGRASARCDYTTTLGTLRFAANEKSKVISIPIIDDSIFEFNESGGELEIFSVTLSNATGVLLSQPNVAVITITDHESSVSGGPNPIDTTSFSVRQRYLDFLNREPDESGFAFWTNQIDSCGADLQCLEIRRINVSAAAFLSIEFQQTGYLVERFYKAGYGNAAGISTFNGQHQLPVPIVRFNEFLKDTQRIGQGVIVLQAGWEQLLASNKQAYALEFVQTTRFISAFPATMTPAEFVDKLNQNAENVLSASERTTIINLFGGASDTSNTTARAQVVRMVAEDQDLYNAEFNRAFVLAEYFGYLRRNPNEAPESTLDYTGYDFWLTKLNQFNGNFINAEMVKAFLSSVEYRQRFGP